MSLPLSVELPPALDQKLRVSPVHEEYVNLFFPLFTNILKMASIPGIILNKRATEELWSFVSVGEILPEEAEAVELSSTAISLAKQGGARQIRPKENVLKLWCRVLYKYHRSDEYRKKCRERNLQQAPFDERHVQALLALAGYEHSAPLVKWAAQFAREYNAAADLVAMSPLPNDSHPRWERRPTTEPHLQAYDKAIKQLKRQSRAAQMMPMPVEEL